MADVHSAAVRSYNMSRIRSENTGPEWAVRKALHRRGFRYRLHDKALPGKPDLVLGRYSAVIFIHGCFWHSHEHCRYFKVPQTRTEWWTAKLTKNRDNDAKHTARLLELGWNVITVFECSLKKELLEPVAERIAGQLRDFAERGVTGELVEFSRL